MINTETLKRKIRTDLYDYSFAAIKTHTNTAKTNNQLENALWSSQFSRIEPDIVNLDGTTTREMKFTVNFWQVNKQNCNNIIALTKTSLENFEPTARFFL